jgi:hypothetical protein
VAEKFLDVAKIGAGVEQVDCERVTQSVRRDIVNVSTKCDVFIDHTADAARSEAATSAVKKDGLIVAFRFRTSGKKYET